VESSYAHESTESRAATGAFVRREPDAHLIGPAVDDALQSAFRAVVLAALAWAEHDYGDVGELEADAGLAEAVRDLRRLTTERGISLVDEAAALSAPSLA
jgi:hypothetical protein